MEWTWVCAYVKVTRIHVGCKMLEFWGFLLALLLELDQELFQVESWALGVSDDCDTEANARVGRQERQMKSQ